MAMTDSEMRTELEAALSGVMAKDGAMLTRWVVLAEVIDNDGTRGLWMMCPEEQKAWDTLGMLRYADQQEAAGVVADHLGDGE